MSRNPYFNVTEAFLVCDLNQNGMVKKDEIRYLLESRGLSVTEKDARSLVKKFDRDCNGVVTYEDFMEEMLPQSPNKTYV